MEEDAELESFFGMLRFFNNNVPVKHQLKNDIESHLTYLWNHDKNAAVRTDEGQDYIAELPEEYQDEIYHKFLFSNFLKSFRYTFMIPKDPEEHKIMKHYYHDFYTWEDQEFRGFMIDFLTYLVPRFEEPGTILIDELESVEEIIFIEHGSLEMGYEINKVKVFAIRTHKN